MGRTHTRPVDRFPEPDFSRLQLAVFADVQTTSPAFDAALREEAACRERAGAAEPAPLPPLVRFGAYDGEELVGWSFGWTERGNAFYVANSGVVASHRRQGVYTQLLGAVRDHATANGLVLLRSHHSVLNNPVIIAKLRFGFHITGLSVSAQKGTLVELSHHMNDARLDVLRSRVIPFEPGSPSP